MKSLKITDVKTYIIPAVPKEKTRYDWAGSKEYILVKIETDKGISGWGECYTLGDRVLSTTVHVEEMKRYLLGSDPTRIEYFRNWVYNLFGERRPGIDMYCAASGVEIAMWDILGKSLDAPVYKLLGGKVMDRLPAYANIAPDGSRSPEEEGRMALEMAKAYGYRSFKIYPFTNDEAEDEIVERVAKVREIIGPDYGLMLDIWRIPDARAALNVARRVERYDICWYEEPIGPDDLDVLAAIKAGTTLPLVAGEAMYGRRWFSEVCKRNCVDYVNPDVAVVGGISEMKAIAAIAEANYIKVGPHNCNSSTVALNATIHASCTMSNLFGVETFPWYEETGDKLCFNQIKVKDGYLEIPEGPGLGIEMNEEYIGSLEYVPKPLKGWKTLK